MAIGENLDLALRIRALVEGQDAIVGLGTSFVDLNQRIELLTRGLTGVFGSTEKASKELDYLAEVADKYGLQLLDLSESYLKLSAAAKDTNLEGEAAKKIFESVSGALAVMGGTTEMTERAFTSLTQMMSKGQIYSEELKGQLAENLPGAIQTLSNALGIGTQDLLRMMEAGNVTSDVLLPFAYELDKQYGKLATSSDTFAQAMNRLKNSWLEVMKGLGDTVIWKALTLTISALGDNVSVVAGLLGGAFGIAVQKSVVGIASLSSAITDNVKSLFNQKAAIQEAAAVAKQSAQAEVAAAEAAAEAAAKRAAQADIQLRESNLLVAANEREVQSLLAKNTVIDTATESVNKSRIANENLDAAKIKLIKAEDAYAVAMGEQTLLQERGNVASAERYRLAMQAIDASERDLASGRARLAQSEIELDNINARVLAKKKEGVEDAVLSDLETRQAIAVDKNIAAQKNMEVVKSRRVAIDRELSLATAEIAAAGDKEFIAWLKNTQALRENVVAAQLAVDKRVQLATAAARNTEGLLAEGGSIWKAADATERLNISQQKNVLIQKEATKATAANAAAQAELAAATQRAELAGAESAAKVGLLAKAWGFLTGPAGMIALVVAGFATMLFSFREQSEATKTLAKDTEDYTNSLDKMNAAQLASVVQTARDQINAKREEVEILEREIQLFDEQGSRLKELVNGWYGFLNVLKFWQSDEEQRRQAVLDLTKTNEDLLILQGKQSIGLIELKDKYDGLYESTKQASAGVDDATNAYNRQKDKVEDLRKQLTLAYINNEDSASIHKELTKAVEDLQVANTKRLNSEANLNTVIQQRSDAEQAYAEFTGLSREAVQALATGNYEYINSLDAKSKEIAKNVQDMDRLQKMEIQLQGELKESKASYEALTTVAKARADQMDKEAKAFGDLNQQRQATIDKANLEVKTAEQAEVIANKELLILQTQLAQKQKLLSINDKNAEKIKVEITDTQALIVKKQAEVEVRKTAIVTSVAEAEAAKNAVTLMKDSYNNLQSSMVAARNELDNLIVEYTKLIKMGAGDSQLELMLGRIKAKELEVTDMAAKMGGKLQQAAKDVGTDWDEMTVGVDFAFQKMTDSIDLLSQQGILTGQQLKESIGKALDGANTTKELETVRDLLIGLYTSGKISEAEFAQGLSRLGVRMAEVKADIDPLASAMKTLGIGVPEQLAAVAMQMQTNVESMQALGVGTDLIRDGFLKAAGSMLDAEAAGIKIDRNWLEQKAASLGLTEALNQLIEARQRESQEFAAVLEKYQDSQALFELELDLIDKEISKRKEQNETDIARSEALGKGLELSRELVQQSALSIEQAESELDTSNKKIQRTRDQIGELENLKNTTSGLSIEQQRNLEELKAGLLVQEQDIEKKKQEVLQAKNLVFSYQNITSEIEKVSNAASASIDIENKVLEAKKNELEEEKKLAISKGDLNIAAVKEYETKIRSIEQSSNEVLAKKAAIQATQNYVEELIKLANQDGKVTEEEAKGIDIAKAAIQVKAEEAKQSLITLEAKKQEARQAEIMAGPVGQLSRLYAANTRENERAADASEAYYQTQLNEVEGAIRVAKAKGDEAEAAELLEKKQQLLIDQAYALAAARRTELADAKNALSVKTLELSADGQLTIADKEQIAVLEAVVVAKANAAQQAADNASAMEKEAAAAKEVAKASKDSTDNINAANTSFKTTAEGLNNLNVGFAKFRDISAVAFGEEGIREYNAIIQDIQSSIDAANTAADNLGKYGMAAATAETQNLADALENSESYLNDAADAAGQNLRQALADAKAEAESLREELSGIATDYSEKILELTGDELTQLYVDRAQALTSAQEKYAAAGTLATQAYQDAKSAIMAYYDLKISKQKEDDATNSLGKTVSNMNALTAATQSATKAAESLAQTNLSGLLNQTTTLSTNVEKLWQLF